MARFLVFALPVCLIVGATGATPTLASLPEQRDPMLESEQDMEALADSMVKSLSDLESRLSSEAYGGVQGFVSKGVPWMSQDDVLQWLQESTNSQTKEVDGRDDIAIVAIVDSLNPRELVDRLQSIIDRPNVLVDPLKNIKEFRRKLHFGTPTDDEVGSANVALSQIYKVCVNIGWSKTRQ